MSEAALTEKLSREHWSDREEKNVPARYIVLKKQVPEVIADEISHMLADAKIRGITLEQDSVRVYPNNNMLCHVIGFVDGENNGADGIEKTMDGYLRGRDGVRYSERDRTGKELVPFRAGAASS